MRTCNSRPSSGFSFVELLLVMLTISVLAAIAAPRYASSLSLYRVRAAAQRIATDLNFAASAARAGSDSRTVSFDVVSNTYQLIGIADVERRAGTWSVLLSDEPYVVTLVSVDLGGDASITFNGAGMPDSGGTVVLRSGLHHRQVDVNSTSGRATVR